MNREDREALRNDIYEFMAAYQDEHSDEPIPPTLAEIQKRFGLCGRNVALAHLKALVEDGRVEVLDRGWRKYVACKEDKDETEPLMVHMDKQWNLISTEGADETKTPKT